MKNARPRTHKIASSRIMLCSTLAATVVACGLLQGCDDGADTDDTDTTGEVSQSSSTGDLSSSSQASTSNTTSTTSADTDTTTPHEERDWWQFGLADDVLDQIALHYLGQVWHQSADVGEVLETLSRVDSAVPASWTQAWRQTAERLEAVARTSESQGHRISASEAYQRAATYYRAALHRHGDPRSPEVAELALRETTAFKRYLELSGSPCEPITFPYENTTLPGYFCKGGSEGPAPTLLFQEGRDGWAEDGLFIANAARKRGYNVMLFDGPGMGQVIRRQGLPFRPDWEAVVSPALDYAISRPETDPARLGLIAVSMGGYLGARAAAHEPRLKLLVVNPGVVNWNAIYEGFLDSVAPGLLDLLESDEAQFNAIIEEFMRQNEFMRWGMVDTMWHHGVETPAQLIREVRKFRLEGQEQQIRANVLVVDAEAEIWGQSKDLFQLLPGQKSYLMFLASEAAQFHVQPGASAIATIRLFDWIDSNI